MVSNYFKFVAKHKVGESRRVHYSFFDAESKDEAEKAFAAAMRNLERCEGTVSVWRMPGFRGLWTTYKVKEVGW